MVSKQDANLTGLSVAFEVAGSPRTLPGAPVWYEREPNNYGEFGGNFKLVARDPINASRQRAKGTITDLDVPGAYSEDFTQNNMQALMQMFMFASLREQPDTISYNVAAIPITAVDGTAHTYSAAGSLVFATGHIVKATGFALPANNGLSVLSGASGTTLTLAAGLATEASPPGAARIQAVGFQFGSGDATLTYSGGVLTFGTTTKDLTTLRLVPGQWVFIGGDSSGLKFATNAPFWARVNSIAAHAVVLDKTTITPVTDAGTDKTVQMFFGPVLRNESDPSLIVKRSLTLERSLGNDGGGVQTELLEGGFGNQLTLHIPQAEKISCDLAFIGMDYATRTGAAGQLSATTGSFVSALGEAAFSTTDDVQRFSIRALDGTLNPTPYFGYVTEGTLNINNNVAVDKAVGVLGGFDTTLGTFEVGGSVTAYFTSVAATAAIRANADVTMDLIVAARNAGFAIDMPLIGLGGGKLTVEKDQAVKLPLETPAYRSAFGHTLCMTWFPYLPNAAIV